MRAEPDRAYYIEPYVSAPQYGACDQVAPSSQLQMVSVRQSRGTRDGNKLGTQGGEESLSVTTQSMVPSPVGPVVLASHRRPAPTDLLDQNLNGNKISRGFCLP